jgi:sulfotransferase
MVDSCYKQRNSLYAGLARVTQFHFIAGLPRSGSTLLAAILRQNPAVTAGMSSPVGGIFQAVQKAVSRGNEAAMFLTDEQRERLLRALFEIIYTEDKDRCQECGIGDATGHKIIFDTNRLWPSKFPVLVKLFPTCKVICCVRHIAWIMDSVERLIRRNTELSGIFGFEPGGTVYDRVQGLASPNGLVGFALNALREGFYGAHGDRLLMVEYEALAKAPRDTIGAIYEWLGIPYWGGHDYEHIEPIPGAAEFDEKLGTPGLHSVRPRVEWQERQTILPPDLFASFPPPFWRSNNPRANVLHYTAS